jgi:hypothetical protein
MRKKGVGVAAAAPLLFVYKPFVRRCNIKILACIMQPSLFMFANT